MFTINQLDRKTNGGVVYVIHWTAKKTEGDHSASIYNSTEIAESDPTSSNFIPYEELTPTIVEVWLRDALGSDQIQSIEQILNAQIEAKKNPVKVSGLPWVTE